MLSLTKIPALVMDVGLPVVMSGYGAVPTVRQRIFKVTPISPSGSDLGGRQTVLVGDNIPKRTGYGVEAPQSTMEQGYVAYWTQYKYQNSMVIPEEIWSAPNAEQQITRMVTAAFGPWAEGFQIAKERDAAAIFNQGRLAAGDADTFDGSTGGPNGYTDPYPKFIYDGKPFFAASGNGHPLYRASSVTPYNLVVSNALSASTLESTRVLMSSTNAVDENNVPINITPNTLLVPPGLVQTAEVLVGSVQQPGTAQNDINTNRGRFDVVEWRYLTDSDGWYLGAAGKGLEFFDSGDPTIVVSVPEAGTGNITIRLRSYAGRYVTDWRYWFANNVATS